MGLIEFRNIGAVLEGTVLEIAVLEITGQSLPDGVLNLALTGADGAALDVLLNFHAQRRVKLVVEKGEQILTHFAASH